MITPGSLARPNSGRSGAFSLTRVSDRLSFLYVDKCRIEQDDNGTHTRIEGDDGFVYTTYLPVATLSCLMLGPGTSISAPAASALARNGCVVLMTGAGVVRMYSAWSPLSGSTALLNAQARISSDPARRTAAALSMLRSRFPDDVIPEVNRDGSPVSLEQLRGIEGARMKAVYQLEARRRRLSGWRRRKDDSDGRGPIDSVNEAMNYANSALYGLCLAVVCSLGMSPGLGIIHEGTARAFVLDLADMYKTDVTIPLAFKQSKSSQPGPDVMRALREEFFLLRQLPRIVDDVHRVVGVEGTATEQQWDLNALSLWGTAGRLVDAEYNRHGIDEQIL